MRVKVWGDRNFAFLTCNVANKTIKFSDFVRQVICMNIGAWIVYFGFFLQFSFLTFYRKQASFNYSINTKIMNVFISPVFHLQYTTFFGAISLTHITVHTYTLQLFSLWFWIDEQVLIVAMITIMSHPFPTISFTF